MTALIYDTIVSVLGIPLQIIKQVQRFQSIDEHQAVELNKLGFINTDDIEHMGDIAEVNLYRKLHESFVFVNNNPDYAGLSTYMDVVEEFIETNGHASLADFMFDVHLHKNKYLSHVNATMGTKPADIEQRNGLH